MVQVANQNQPLATYAYNFLGQRAAKTTPSAITHFLYDRAGHLLAESNGATGAAQTEYVWLGDMALAVVTNGNLYFIHPDHLGTPQKATDATQALAWDAVLRPFGQTEQQTFPSLTNLRLPGQYFDAESGLHQNRFRDYDPSTGRYIESDPIGVGGGTNLYAYVGSNPIEGIDTLGLSPRCAADPDPAKCAIECNIATTPLCYYARAAGVFGIVSCMAVKGLLCHVLCGRPPGNPPDKRPSLLTFI